MSLRIFTIPVSLLLLVGCSTGTYYSDATQRWKAPQIVGQCYRLRVDATVNHRESALELRHSKKGVLTYDGWIRCQMGECTSDGKNADPGTQFLLPKGSRIHVETVLAGHYPNVGISLDPYARLDPEFGSLLIDAEDLFIIPRLHPDEAVIPASNILVPCE